MELIDVLQKIGDTQYRARGTTDLVIGTVTSEKPLAITTEDTRMVLPQSVLPLTESVVEKKIPMLTHRHMVSGLTHTQSYSGGVTQTDLAGAYPTDERLSEIVCTEHGKALPTAAGFIVLNRALTNGDKVLLVRVLAGQKFIVLSRVF